jgi:hypothetical protein
MFTKKPNQVGRVFLGLLTLCFFIASCGDNKEKKEEPKTPAGDTAVKTTPPATDDTGKLEKKDTTQLPTGTTD